MIPTTSAIFAQYGVLLATLVFVVFFASWFAAFVFRDRLLTYRPYMVGIFCLVLVGSTLTGLQPTPIHHVNEYSSVAPTEDVHYDIRVVDADGTEIPYDPRAMRPNLQNEEIAENIAKVGVGSQKTDLAYTESERDVMAAFLFDEALEHRRHVVAERDYLRPVRFPPHHLRNRLVEKADNYWTTDQLDDYAPFVALRIYRMHVVIAEDGSEVTVADERLVYEYRPGDTETA